MKRITLFFPIFFICVVNIFPQNQSGEKKLNRWGYLNYLKPSNNEPKIPFQKSSIIRLVKFVKNIELRLSNKLKDELGLEHEYYNIYYNKIRIAGFSYSIHGKDGYLYSLSGNYFDPTSAPIKPTLTEEEALSICLKTINAKKYFWEDMETERKIKVRNNNPSATYYPKGELVIIPDNKSTDIPGFKLCYLFEVSALNPAISEFVFVDAMSKTVYLRKSKFRYLNDVQATAETRYSGTQTIWTNFWYPSSTSYSLFEKNISGHPNYTLNWHNTNSNWLLFEDQDNYWSATEWNNANGDNVALDIHWAAEKSYEYFKTVHNRDGYNNNATIYNENYAHYYFENSATQAQAAYTRYHTSDLGGVFLFGSGDVNHDQMGSLDIFGHEYGHGLWDFTVGNASFENDIVKEWGAIQEGISNAWGAAIEAWVAPSKNHWLSGEEVTYSGAGISNLANPNATLQPDTYHGQYWQNTNCGTPDGTNDYCGIHTNAGIVQYWFYLLSQGGNGVNDLYNTYTVSGVGITNAAKILLRAMAIYHMGSNIDISDGAAFYSARTATTQAATDLFGNNSCELVAVMNAWYAVGVGDAFIAPYSLLTYNQLACDESLIICSQTRGTSFVWEVTGDLLINGTSTTLTTTTPNVPVVGTHGTVYVNIYGPCNSHGEASIEYYPAERIINYGTPTPLLHNDHLSVSVFPYLYATNYKWYVNNTLVKEGENAYYYCTCYYEGPDARQCGQNNVRVEIVTNCGTFPFESEFEWICGYRANQISTSNIKIFPNPTSGQINVSVTTSIGNVANQIQSIRYINILDKFNNIRRRYDYLLGSKSVVLNLSELPIDIYYIEISDGKNKVVSPISIRH